MQQAIDKRIKQAQRKGAGVYILSGLLTLIILIGFIFWLFLIKGYSLLIGPNEASDNAQVDLVSGLAWVGERKIYTLGGEIVIRVSANTFETTEVTIDQQSPSTVEIFLLPSPAVIIGQAVLSGPLENAKDYLSESQWFLNGTLIHVGGELSYKTPPGKYQLEVSNRFYESTSQPLDLGRAEKIEVSPTLATVNGMIVINSVPQGIDVSIDGANKGKTPITFPAQGGEYQVILSSTEYKTIEDTIAVQTRFLRPTRNYQLIPKLGVLNFSANPSDGLLLINNVEYKLGTIELPANRSHKIEYKKVGYSSFTKNVKLSKDEETNIQVNLEPLYGQVIVNTNVPALISINGNNKENSPVSKRLLSIQNSVEASANGYRTTKQNFTPRPNKSLVIDLELMTEFDARRKEGKPLFTNTLGINLQKFKADAFTLGSPANETGRRRNEHEVEVDFTRQFWVSEKEITQTQFTAFLSAKQAVKSTLPVTGVSWLEAAQYTNWLSQQEGLPLFYRFQNGRYLGVNISSNGYRLPTEAEWEWLAKKSKRAVSTPYVWGNQEKLRDNVGNFADKTMNGKQLIFFEEYTDGKTGVAEVGSFKADRSGLFDLDGNVSEWVHDYYTNGLPDTSKIHSDYLGSPRGDSWVIKGGNYETGRLRELRGAYREYSTSGKATVGFRIARYDKPL
jgi:formylglycine-generating enzyme required for sulfatase activity